ncbi:MAG: cytochrome c maturation protein CcmE, partial [Acidimicrobiales bacterium]
MTDASPPVDLTPRPARQGSTRSKWLPLALLVAVAVAVVGLIWFLVTNSQAFLEADVAVEERDEQGDKRFQLLGSPIADADQDDTVVLNGEEHTPFTIVFDGVKVDVISQGAPPDLFDEGIPVVLEGHWVQDRPPAGVEWPAGANDGWYFESDRILVKHDNDYRQDRIDEAEDRGQVDDEP